MICIGEKFNWQMATIRSQFRERIEEYKADEVKSCRWMKWKSIPINPTGDFVTSTRFCWKYLVGTRSKLLFEMLLMSTHHQQLQNSNDNGHIAKKKKQNKKKRLRLYMHTFYNLFLLRSNFIFFFSFYRNNLKFNVDKLNFLDRFFFSSCE